MLITLLIIRGPCVAPAFNVEQHSERVRQSERGTVAVAVCFKCAACHMQCTNTYYQMHAARSVEGIF